MITILAKKQIGFAAAAILLAACSSSQKNNNATGDVVKEGAEPVLISSQFKFTEGPAADKNGNVFFTDQPNNKIWRYGTDGSMTVFKDPAGRSNGLYFDKQGNLLAAADEKNQLWSIAKDGKETVLLTDLDGKLFNGPNDLWIHPNGSIYFTDPYYERDYWTRKGGMQLDGKKVYYLAKGSTKPVAVISNFVSPNGIIGTPDGKYLYVADIGGNKTWRYTIQPDGMLAQPTLLIEQGSDGMTLDDRGNVYLTGKGVTVVNPGGKIIKQIPIDAKWTANVTFGGKKNDKLFITASEKLYVLDMNVHGAR